ncbi:MAG: 6-carboxytetrahydropterin synthase, partial [Pirellulaceae bacterium]|nr:6-carboxytetrahydropterin synthase [Pirellulaceae bacterium]
MLIRKEYKFYAAHRNEELSDKCRNLHGHRYGVTCFFEVERTGALTTLLRARTLIDGGSITLFDGASSEGRSTGASPLCQCYQRWIQGTS